MRKKEGRKEGLDNPRRGLLVLSGPNAKQHIHLSWWSCTTWTWATAKLAAPSKQGKIAGGNREICWSRIWLPSGTRTEIFGHDKNVQKNIMNTRSMGRYLPIKTSFLSRMFFWGSWAAELPASTVLPTRSGSPGITPRPRSLRRSSRISKSPLGPTAPTSLLASLENREKFETNGGITSDVVASVPRSCYTERYPAKDK